MYVAHYKKEDRYGLKYKPWSKDEAQQIGKPELETIQFGDAWSSLGWRRDIAPLGSSVPALAKGARDKILKLKSNLTGDTKKNIQKKIWTIANRDNIKVQNQLPWSSEGNPKGQGSATSDAAGATSGDE